MRLRRFALPLAASLLRVGCASNPTPTPTPAPAPAAASAPAPAEAPLATPAATAEKLGGYWLLASDGGMFSFGKAQFYGSLPGTGACTDAADAVAFTGTITGHGYWVVLADGQVMPFGDAEHFADAPKNARPVSFAVKR